MPAELTIPKLALPCQGSFFALHQGMARLKDRTRSIPNGFKFPVPAANFNPIPYSSFETIVRAVYELRRANPYLSTKNNWALDLEQIREEVDSYNAQLCLAHGWGDYIVDAEGQAAPKSLARSNRSVGARVAGGAKLLADWLGQGGKPVPKAEAEGRAGICATCPKNDIAMHWTEYFTVPASAIIKKQLSVRSDLSLETTHDAELGVCAACSCPLKLKVWTPLEHILKFLTPEVKADLDPRCWILKASEPK